MNCWRWMLLIALATFVSGVLLSFRHQRLMLMHETIDLHRQLDRARQQRWEYEYQISQYGNTQRVREALQEQDQTLVPIVGMNTETPRRNVARP